MILPDFKNDLLTYFNMIWFLYFNNRFFNLIVIDRYKIEQSTHIFIDYKGLAPKTECIRRKDYIENNGSAIIRGLLPGNYSIRIQAVSLSKQDRFTNYTYYIIQVLFALSLSLSI